MKIEKKKKSVSLPKLKNKLQDIFNEFIRLRDAGQPCISCGENKPLQAGHYFAVKGYDSLRFDEFVTELTQFLVLMPAQTRYSRRFNHEQYSDC